MTFHSAKKSVFISAMHLLSCAALLWGTNALAMAAPKTVAGPEIITTPVVYKNRVLNLSNGYLVKNGGSLDIEDSVVNIDISPENPWFARLAGGDLIVSNTTFNIVTHNITPVPTAVSPYQLIRIDQGKVTLMGNEFSIAQPFTVGFLSTNASYTTTGFIVHGNNISNFHGGLYLVNSGDVTLTDNTFSNVSLVGILGMGLTTSSISRNIFSFPGNLLSGDALQLIASDNLVVSGNIIASGAGDGILIAGSQNVSLDSNKITDGASFAIRIQAVTALRGGLAQAVKGFLTHHRNRLAANSNITVTNNYLAQNRYGLIARAVDTLTVRENVFIQKFGSNQARRQWTNNDLLLTETTGLTWADNSYKEAFSQEVPGDNQLASQFVSYPEHGGVIWP